MGVCAWLAAPGSAATFGTPLGTAPFNAPPANPSDCGSVPVPAFNLNEPLLGPNGGVATSCIWAHVPTPAETAAGGGANVSLEPPGTGTVTQVRVGVGPITGPMQVVVMRALYQNTVTPGHPNDACCTPVARSPVFTPRANAITTVPVSLPVREDPTPGPTDITTIATFDTLGLAVLAPGIPVPLYYTGDPSAPADFVWNTATPSTVTPGFTTDTGGFFVALSADWSAGAGGGGGAGATNRGAAIRFPASSAPVRGRSAAVPLQCLLSTTCRGRLPLQSALLGARVAASPGSATRLRRPGLGIQSPP